MTDILTSHQWLESAQSQNQLFNYSVKEIEKRLEFGTYVGDKLNYVFVATSKASCSTMKWLLVDLENRHVEYKHCGRESSLAMIIHARTHGIKNIWEITDTERAQVINNPNTVRFCVVRNPYARFVSGWSDKVRQKEPSFQALWQQIGDYFGTDPSLCPTFEQFARWMVETQNSDKCNAHWRSMAHLLLPDLMNYTHILHTENLENELEEVIQIIAPHRSAAELLKKHRMNESLPIDWKACYTEELAELVSEFYQEDFKRFGYSLDSWRPKTSTRTVEEELIALKEQFSKFEASAIEAVRVRNDVIFELTEKKNPIPLPLTPQKQKKTVLILGDAHARVFKRENWLNLTPDWSWKPVLVENASLVSTSNPDLQKKTKQVFKDAISKYSAEVVLFCLCEAYTGLFIWKAAETKTLNLRKTLDKMVENYCQLLTLASKSANVIVLSAPLPTIEAHHSGNPESNDRTSLRASLIERTELTSQFNKIIQIWCFGQNITYINLDSLSKGQDNLVSAELRHPNPKHYQYNPPNYLKILKNQLLPVIKNAVEKP